MSSAISCIPIPPIREFVHVKYSSMISCESPRASKICAPRYPCNVEMPILDIVFRTPSSTALQ